MGRKLREALALLREGKLGEPTDAAVLSGFSVCHSCLGLGELRGEPCGSCGGDGRHLRVVPAKSIYTIKRSH